MRTLYFDKRMEFRQDFPDPVPGTGEALIRIILAGICNTDLEIVRGYMAFQGIPGHEFVGRVEACEDPSWIGKRVVGEINVSCGRCEFCRKGIERHCPHRSVLGIFKRPGIFADLVCLPIRNLHPVDESIGDRQAVFTEPLAAAVEIMEQVHLSPGLPVAVLGDGKLGLLVALVLSSYGTRVTLFGHHPERMKSIAEDRFAWSPADRSPAVKFPVVVEATGTSDGLNQALETIEPRGNLILKSTVADASRINAAKLVVDEIRVTGSRCGPFPPALELLKRERYPLDKMIDAVYPLDRGVQAFEQAAKKGICKVLLEIE